MFSKFLQCKDEEGLAAIKMQFQMEFAKANRKFQKNKKNPVGEKRGRPALGQLKLSQLLSNANKMADDAKTVDLTKIARSVATTREGRRLHDQVTKGFAGENENQKKVFVLINYCFFFSLSLFEFFCVLEGVLIVQWLTVNWLLIDFYDCLLIECDQNACKHTESRVQAVH